ncbi:hypothetical protein EV361DRAFT_491428 [Lentinula raphanica]|nr:hypothetical protein EV361DRAFT_491428 [Lentinula raphanica]
MATPLYDLENVDVTPFALGIPEILENIFEHSDKFTNCNSNVLVCRTWLEPCLNVIWREVEDLSRLVKLLAPTSSHAMEFLRVNEPLNWDRFGFYARRVRRIYHEGNDSPLTNHTNFALRSLFTDIAYQRTSYNLCPNLKVLEWCGDASLYMKNPSVLFMGPSVRRYILHDVKPTSNELAFVLQTIADRCPNLNHILINIDYVNQSYVDIIRDFIQKVGELHSVDLDPFEDMSPIITALRDHPNLRELHLGDCHAIDDDLDKPAITSLALPSPCGNEFASLTLLNIAAAYAVVKDLLAIGLPLLQETIITSDLRKPETPSTVKRLIETLAEKSPKVDDVHLSYGHIHDKNFTRFPPASCIVTMDHIRPLLSCTKMRNFVIKHPFPITLNDEFAEELTISWPDLSYLQLSPKPLIRRKDFKNCFTLKALLSFARHCPRISYLSFLVAPQSSACPTPADIENLPTPFFPKLRMLDVGSSMLYGCDKHDVTLTLARILPARSYLRYHDKRKSEDAETSPDDDGPLPPEAYNWESIISQLTYVRYMDEKAKQEQKDLQTRIQELEAENERLRTQA